MQILKQLSRSWQEFDWYRRRVVSVWELESWSGVLGSQGGRGSAVSSSSPSGVRGGAPTAKKFSCIPKAPDSVSGINLHGVTLQVEKAAGRFLPTPSEQWSRQKLGVEPPVNRQF